MKTAAMNVGADSEKSKTEMKSKIKIPFSQDKIDCAAEFYSKKVTVMKKWGSFPSQIFMVQSTNV